MSTVPTIQVVHREIGETIRINESDFDSSLHLTLDEAAAAAVSSQEPASPETAPFESAEAWAAAKAVDAIAALETVERVEFLDELQKAEEAGGARKTVLAAIEVRRAALAPAAV